MTATMVWQYTANPPIFNDFTGSAQRLENGNTVVAFTRKGIVDEVRPDGSLLARATIESAPGKIATPYRVTRIKSLYFVRATLGALDSFKSPDPPLPAKTGTLTVLRTRQDLANTQIFERSASAILRRQRRRLSLKRPFDSKIGIIPAKAPLSQRIVVVGRLVQEVGTLAGDEKAMRQTGRNP